MALLDNTHQQYYQSNNHGDYQFISLRDIINQFMIVYVGEDKIIPNARRLDVAFHAQRALAELSFDTLKSFKAQEIVVPATLQMILPHDYVNYTKISWSDAAGIKHPLYPTKHTSNPFMVSQDSDGNYIWPSEWNIGVNMDFSEDFVAPWFHSTPSQHNYDNDGATPTTDDTITTPNEVLTFKQHVQTGYQWNYSYIYAVWQELDVSTVGTLNLSADGVAQGAATNIIGGQLRIGITNESPSVYNPPEFKNDGVTPWGNAGPSNIYYASSIATSPNAFNGPPWISTLDGNDAYLEWSNGEDSTKSFTGINGIDVTGFNTVWVVITSVSNFDGFSAATTASTLEATYATNTIDNIIITSAESMAYLSNVTNSSTTWSNYKSGTPSENQDDYQDDTYWPLDGSRYGLDPSHAQVNGSFFIDQRLGKIHFSSNISGKTVILDYISDGLGTEEEMQVHKLAEEAMYRCILYGIAAGRVQTQQLVPRLKKEKFAATRQAKLRLSNIKLEEITQILRGKSKHIKH